MSRLPASSTLTPRLPVRLVSFFVGWVVIATAFTAFPSFAEDADTLGCPGKERAPVLLEVIPDATPISPGSNHVMTGRLFAEAPIESIECSFTATGPVTLTGSQLLQLGDLAEGDSIDFAVPLQFTGSGEATVDILVTIGQSAAPLNRRLFSWVALVRSSPYQSFTGFSGHLNLALEALQADSTGGLVPPGDVDSLRMDLLDAGVTADVDSMPSGPASLAAQFVTIVGKFRWVDRNGGTHPTFNCRVELYDAESGDGKRLLSTGQTNAEGVVTFLVENEDGFLAGGIDPFLIASTTGPRTHVHAPKSGAAYWARTPGLNNVSSNKTYNWDIVITKNDAGGQAFGIQTALSHGAAHSGSQNGMIHPPLLDCEWPLVNDKKNSIVSNYSASKVKMFLLEGDRWDWDVILHEYGHHVEATYQFDDSPGGAHSSRKCLSVVHGSKSKGIRLAWSEGWATYFSISSQLNRNLAAQGIPDVGDVRYTDTEDADIDYSIETKGAGQVGEDNEASVARSFHDLEDAADDGLDRVTLGHQSIWDRIKMPKPKTLSAAWGAIAAAAPNQQEVLRIGGAAAEHELGPTLVAPADLGVVVPGTVLEWTRGVGCSSYQGNRFDLKFWKPGNPPTVVATPATMLNVTGTKDTVSADELAALISEVDEDSHLLWSVAARNIAAPTTGPYLGMSRTIELSVPAGIPSPAPPVPVRFAMSAVRPNPSRGGVWWTVTADLPGSIDVRIFDVTGRLIRSPEGTPVLAGTGTLTWDARDDQGRRVSPGLYFVEGRMGSHRATVRIVLVP